jgi:succinyl-CoA synthetase alpha subunit
LGVVSRSGTLSYEAVDQLTKAGFGQSTVIGIGGDPIPGTTIRDAVQLFMNDPGTNAIVMIGEIGGTMETDAGLWIRDHGTKPVVSFIAGATAPKGRTMGHAGAIVGGKADTAQAKKEILKECGVHVIDSPADVANAIGKVIRP